MMMRWTIAEIGTLDEVAFTAALPACSGSFSLALWMIAAHSDKRQVIAKLGEVYGDGWLLVLEDQRLRVEAVRDGMTQLMAATAISVGSWQAVALVVDVDNDGVTLALNGTVRDEQPLPPHLPEMVTNLLIGGYTDPAGGHYDHTFGRRQTGWVDDVRWFPDALSAEEIRTLATSQAGEPRVSVRVLPESWEAPTVVRFNASGSNVPDGAVRACVWDFGDGTTALGSNVQHAYRYAGNYVVRLTVIGDNHRQMVHESALRLSGEVNPLQAAPVFINGTEGYACYRIPAVVRAANGDLLAFAEGRVESCSDSTATIRIVCKRSSDQGRTWSPVQVVARNVFKGGEGVVNNCSPVVDHVRGSGRVLVLYNKAQHSEWELAAGSGTSRICAIVSDDHGVTWHSETDISEQVQQLSDTPDSPAWRVQRPTLGHALQLRDGRLVFAGMFTAGTNTVFQSQNYLFWSDDLGATWQRGAAAGHIGLNEATAVDLESGQILINSRAYIDQQSAGCRALTIATFLPNGAVSYQPTRFDPVLVDSAVQASMLRYSYSQPSDNDSRGCILFSNPAHPSARNGLTVRLSRDEGQTWQISKLIDAGPSAYSDLVMQSDGGIGVLYERGNQGGIVYVNFTLDWLTETRDTSEAEA